LNRLLALLDHGECSSLEIRKGLSLVDRNYVRDAYLTPALRLGYIEYTIPDKPHSRLQKYRLTDRGRAVLANLTQ
jgi:ATP-dependent DNA helicase RecG